MRSSVSVRAEKAQKGTPAYEITTKSSTHSHVGPCLVVPNSIKQLEYSASKSDTRFSAAC
jgi:hypothetical protein